MCGCNNDAGYYFFVTNALHLYSPYEPPAFYYLYCLVCLYLQISGNFLQLSILSEEMDVSCWHSYPHFEKGTAIYLIYIKDCYGVLDWKWRHPMHFMLQFSKCFDRSRNNKCIVNLSSVKLETKNYQL